MEGIQERLKKEKRPLRKGVHLNPSWPENAIGENFLPQTPLGRIVEEVDQTRLMRKISRQRLGGAFLKRVREPGRNVRRGRLAKKAPGSRLMGVSPGGLHSIKRVKTIQEKGEYGRGKRKMLPTKRREVERRESVRSRYVPVPLSETGDDCRGKRGPGMLQKEQDLVFQGNSRRSFWQTAADAAVKEFGGKADLAGEDWLSGGANLAEGRSQEGGGNFGGES